MYCSKCGELIEEGAHFCNYCGESMSDKPASHTMECARCHGTGKVIDELGLNVRCPVCKGGRCGEDE